MSRPGQLDQQVTFQAATTTSDGGGGESKAWADFSTDPTVWADVQPMRGSEGLEGTAHNARGSYVFIVRNRTDVTELDRIMWDSVPYNIRNVKRRGGRELYLTIEAERGVAQ